MPSYTIKKGDTLSKVAQQYGVSVDQILSANQGSSAIKGKNTIFAGGTINVPEQAKATTQQAAPQPAAEQVPGASAPVKQAEDPFAKWSASFLSKIEEGQKSISDISGAIEKPTAKSLEEEAALPESQQSPEYKAYQATRAATKASFDVSREEIQQAKEEGQASRERALSLLGMTPAAVRQNIETFAQQSDSFEKSIARSLERISIEEKNAEASGDYQYRQFLRQQKMDYLNTQRTLTQDSISLMGQAMNFMLTGRQYQRQEEESETQKNTNYLNAVMSAYKGTGATLASLSPNEKQKVGNALTKMGLSEDWFNSMNRTEKDLQIIHDSATGWIIAVDKRTGKQVSRTLAPGRTGAVESSGKDESIQDVSLKTTSALKSYASRTADGKVKAEDYASLYEYWKTMSPSSSKYFLLNNPPATFLRPATDEKDPDRKKIIEDMYAAYDKLNSSQAQALEAISSAFKTQP